MTGELLNQSAPIFKHFTLFGLHGYKDVSLSCHSPVKIACADNGSGKTSVLNALYSIFEGRAALLYAIDFESIEIVWADGSSQKSKKNELFGALNEDSLASMAEDRFFEQHDVRKEDAFDLLTKFILGDLDEVVQTDAYKEIYQNSPWDRNDVFERLEAICEPLLQSGSFSDFSARAREKLNGASVLYLPTYRRIEADIPEYRSVSQHSGSYRARGKAQKDAWNSTRLIFFGMKDVETKLHSILSQIRKETLAASTRSNGQTLEQLIEPTTDSTLQESFDLSSIEVVLARVGKNTPELRAGLARLIQSGEIFDENRGELRRFLSQLLKVYALRREDEEAIERFVNTVNSYLCPEGGDETEAAIRSEKRLSYDKVNLESKVKNTITGKEIKFGSLSSGEKQVVSIFARLMLDPRRKYLILVDEPELSLSLEWQQRLLPDVCSAPNFHQLVAITHSPFIFDNELSLAAGALETKYKKVGEYKE